MEAYIFDAVRTPRGKGKASSGGLTSVSPVELAAVPLKALLERNGFDTREIGDVVLGCVEPVMDQAADIARSAVLLAGYDHCVPGQQINRFCASGLDACATIAAKVASGQIELGIGGGVEMMSRMPMGSSGYPPLTDPVIAVPNKMIPQGISADLLATLSGYSRRDVDEYAFTSQSRAVSAWAAGKFSRGVVSVKDRNGLVILAKDELLRQDVTVESLGKMEPSFAAMAVMGGFDSVAIQRYPEVEAMQYLHHPGNSSGISDAAAAILIGSELAGSKYSLKPRARIRSFASIGSEPTVMLTGPDMACRRALALAGMTHKDIDLWEVNEAFSSVVLRFIEDSNIDIEQVNVNGGAIAMGHPLGATGAILLGTLVDELERSNRETGVVTLCAASGMAVAMVIERV
jgi:acetyl-CoA C-acetyltransferase